ncbi:MAG: tripartite tricarboxylate transporter permease, partial [Clostridiales bacterium]|nr:tripartite tricarboxylate transporter permease [Clostridiales bacterium]
LHINTGTIRYSKAFPILWDGFTPLWLVLGIYAIFQIMLMPRLKDEIEGMRGKIVQRKAESPFEFYGLGIKLIKKHIAMMLKGSVLGTVIGIIPGIGAMTSAWLAYAMAQKTGKERDLVGKGSIEAIACIESANNAAVPGTLIPMFALGIPGNGTAAIIMSLFVMSGVYPGPQMMAQNGDVIWSIVFGIFITGIAFWILAYPFRLAIGYMLKLPIEWMIAIMGPLVLMGCYLAKNSFTGGNIALAVTLLAIFCAYTGINSTGILLGNILCRMIETDLIRAYQLEGFSRYTKPSAMIMILVVLATLGFGFFSSYFSKKRKESEGSTIKMVGQSDDEELEFDAAGENIIELSEEEKLLGKEKRKALAENKDAYTRLLAGLVAIALAIAVFVMSGSFTELSQVWPRFVAIAFVLAPGLILLAQAFYSWGKIVRHFTERPKATKKKIRDVSEGWVVFALMILCFNLGKWIGFIESSTLYALLIMLYFQPKKIKEALLATATVAVLLVVMKIGFQLLLPVGPLGI